MITEQERFIAGDLDHCRAGDTGKLTLLAARIVAGFATYWEVTPSGTGLKFFATGDGGRSFRGHRIEAHTAGRFLTVTGQRHGDIEEPAPIPPAPVARLREQATDHQNNGARDPGSAVEPIIVGYRHWPVSPTNAEPWVAGQSVGSGTGAAGVGFMVTSAAPAPQGDWVKTARPFSSVDW